MSTGTAPPVTPADDTGAPQAQVAPGDGTRPHWAAVAGIAILFAAIVIAGVILLPPIAMGAGFFVRSMMR